MFGNLQSTGLNFMKEKMTPGASEVKYLEHVKSLHRINVLPVQIQAVQNILCPLNLRALQCFV